MRVCRSPWLIAAYHGLHRLCVPRHPPHAIARLTTKEIDVASVAQRFRRFSIHVSKQSTLISASTGRKPGFHASFLSFTSEHSKLRCFAASALCLLVCSFHPTIYHTFRCPIAALPVTRDFR